MKELSLSQKKMFIGATGIMAVFLIMWFVIYTPMKHVIKGLKKELVNIEMQIKQIETIIDKSKDAGESIRLLQQKYDQMSAKFPKKEEECLEVLSRIARELNIKVVSVTPQAKTQFFDKNKKEIGIDGEILKKVVVSIEMKGSYEDLIKYLEILKNYSPFYTTVENAEINKGNFEERKLSIILKINLYLLS